jgi:hypothetical protein
VRGNKHPGVSALRHDGAWPTCGVRYLAAHRSHAENLIWLGQLAALEQSTRCVLCYGPGFGSSGIAEKLAARQVGSIKGNYLRVCES